MRTEKLQQQQPVMMFVDMWTEMAALKKMALDIENPAELLFDLPDKMIEIAEEEERVFRELRLCV